MRYTFLTALFIMAFIAGSVHAQQEGNVGMTGTDKPGMDTGISGVYGGLLSTDIGEKLYNLGNASLYLDHQDELELTDAQVSRLRSLRDQHRTEISEYGEKLAVLRGEIRDIVNSDIPGIDDLKMKIRELQNTRTQRYLAEIDYGAESSAVLDSEQQGLAFGLSGGDITVETPFTSPSEQSLPPREGDIPGRTDDEM